MDDSFSDFKAKKKCKIGPKSVAKFKSKTKKPLKKSKGQKDIRSLIKKSEIISYSKDFNEVCQQTGIDVDAEQLQLAIALSKSLVYQSATGSRSEDVEIQNKPLSSQERSAKIKSTLQEYGFKVHNSKVSLSLTTSKRKKYSKNSILLKISNEERQKKISNKYIKVLAQNAKTLDVEPDCNYMRHEVFYKATNIQYEFIKNNDSFYVGDLIEKATHKSNLFRDWSEIPGRPKSPKPLTKDVDFDAIQCSQLQLDEILSCSIDIAQSIVKSKQNSHGNTELECDSKTEQSEASELTECVQPSNDDESANSKSIDDHIINLDSLHITEENAKSKEIKLCNDNNESKLKNQAEDNNDLDIEAINIQIDDIEQAKNITVNTIEEVNESVSAILSIDTSQVLAQEFPKNKLRSASPDLFDDECSILDKNDSSITIDKNDTIFMDLTGSAKEIDIYLNNHILEIPRKPHCIIDITEYGTSNNKNHCDIFELKCIDIIDITCVNINTSKDKGDVTKKKSNDIIEITESVNNNDNTTKVDQTNSENNMEMVDLTQVIIDELPKIDLGCKNASLELDDTIIYVNNEPLSELNTSKETNEDTNKMDISNNSNDVIVINSQENRQIISNDGGSKINEDVNIDLTQGSGHSELNCAISVEFTDDYSQNVNYDTFNNNETLTNDKDVSLEIDIQNQSKINDHCDVGNLNSNSDTLDNDNNESLKSNISSNMAPSDKDTDIQEVLSDCSLEQLNKNPHTHKSDNDTIISLVCEKFVPIYNDTDKQDVNIDLTQASDKSLQEENNYINNIENVNNVEIIEEYELHSISQDDSHFILSPVNDRNDLSCNGQNANSRLGKVDNISVDCDNMFDEITAQNKVSTTNSNIEVSNKNSGKFEISLREFNYSMLQSVYEDIDNYGNDLPAVDLSPNNHKTDNKYILNTPIQVNSDFQMQTIDNHEYIIKTRSVTPMPDYENMPSPEMDKELDKFGLKRFKRKRAIQLLTYIYNQTHPLIETYTPEEVPSKKFKSNPSNQQQQSKIQATKNQATPPKKKRRILKKKTKVYEIEKYAVTNEIPLVENVRCKKKDWVFQTEETSEIPWCREPLHIAFHNYLTCRKFLRETILKFGEVNYHIIYKDLLAYGYRFNGKELQRFLDKKGILVKSVVQNTRKRKRVRRKSCAV